MPACLPARLQVQRNVKILEDRLQQASVRYNDTLTRSRRLRDRIDGLRRERMLFGELQGKLARGLEGKKAEMVELIGRIAELHEAREKVSGWALDGWPLGGAVVRADEKGKASSRFVQLLHPCIFGRLSCYVCLPTCLTD